MNNKSTKSIYQFLCILDVKLLLLMNVILNEFHKKKKNLGNIYIWCTVDFYGKLS